MCLEIDTICWSGMTIHRAVESRYIELHRENKNSLTDPKFENRV